MTAEKKTHEIVVALRELWVRQSLPLDRFDALAAKYNEKHRAYHTLEHLFHMFRLLTEVEELRHAAAGLSPEAQKSLNLAIWYHDREYDPARSDNELLSLVRFLGDAAELNADINVRNAVAGLILLSRHHDQSRALGLDPLLAQIFCDLDLSILGAPASAYDQYAADVRQEYAHVPTPLYNRGRAKVLRNLQSYRYSHLQIRQKAMEFNLARELSSLKPTSQLAVMSALIQFAFSNLGRARGSYSALLPEAANGELYFPRMKQKRLLWATLSELYLDTEIDPGQIGQELARLGFSHAEVQYEIFKNVGPLLAGNLGFGLYPVIGAWAGFDSDWLEGEILARRCTGSTEPGRLSDFLNTWFIRRDIRAVLKAMQVSP